MIPLTQEELQIVKATYDQWKQKVEAFKPNFHSPEAKKFFEEQEACYERTHAFKKRERITAWFCQRGTTGQQFEQIQVRDQNGSLIEPRWDQNDPRAS